MNTSLLHKEIMGYFVDRLEKKDENLTTYYGYHIKDSSPVAIKVITNLSHLLPLENLQNVVHANLVKVHKVEQIDDAVVVVRDWIEGENLAQYVVKKPSLTEIINAVKHCFLGLSYLHKHGFFHNKIVSNNVYFCEKNTLLLCDFSLHDTDEGSEKNDIQSVHKILYALITADASFEKINIEIFKDKLSFFVDPKNKNLQNMIIEFYEKLEKKIFLNAREALISLQPIIGLVYQSQHQTSKIQIQNTSNTRMLEQLHRTNRKKKQGYGLQRSEVNKIKSQKIKRPTTKRIIRDEALTEAIDLSAETSVPTIELNYEDTSSSCNEFITPSITNQDSLKNNDLAFNSDELSNYQGIEHSHLGNPQNLDKSNVINQEMSTIDSSGFTLSREQNIADNSENAITNTQQENFSDLISSTQEKTSFEDLAETVINIKEDDVSGFISPTEKKIPRNFEETAINIQENDVSNFRSSIQKKTEENLDKIVLNIKEEDFSNFISPTQKKIPGNLEETLTHIQEEDVSNFISPTQKKIPENLEETLTHIQEEDVSNFISPTQKKIPENLEKTLTHIQEEDVSNFISPTQKKIPRNLEETLTHIQEEDVSNFISPAEETVTDEIQELKQNGFNDSFELKLQNTDSFENENASKNDVIFDDKENAAMEDLQFKHIDLQKEKTPSKPVLDTIKNYTQTSTIPIPNKKTSEDNKNPQKLSDEEKKRVLRRHASKILKKIEGTGTYVIPKPLKKEYQRKRLMYISLSCIVAFAMTTTYIKLHTEISFSNAIGYFFAEKTSKVVKISGPKGWFNETMPLGLEKSKRFGEYFWSKDKSIMLYVSKGLFWRGTRKSKNASPIRKIYLSGYYIDKYELSNQKYKYFVEEKKYKPSKYNKHKRLGEKIRPVVGITWYDAKNYAKWSHKRLPSEAEWEKAARGGIKIGKASDEGKKYTHNKYPTRPFPWGIRHNKKFVHLEKKKNVYTVPVTAFLKGRSPYGCHNMLGNVAEWCEDKYQTKYYKHSSSKNPTGPKKKLKFRVYRGGSWLNKLDTFIHTRRALHPKEVKRFIGVRFVVSGVKNE